MPPETVLSFLPALDTRPRGVAVLQALAGMVARAGLKVGDRLPPEVQLAQSLGVGRSTLREALNRWEGLGLIRRRRGDGTYLAAPISTAEGALPVMVQLEGHSILRLIEVRRVVETAVVRLAAERASPAQRNEIVALCDTLLAVVDAGRDYDAADWAFHSAIHDACGNPMLGQILVRLNEMMERSDQSPFTRTAFGVSSFPPHRDLADAVAAGAADRAEAALRMILDSVESEVHAIIAGDRRQDT